MLQEKQGQNKATEKLLCCSFAGQPKPDRPPGDLLMQLTQHSEVDVGLDGISDAIVGAALINSGVLPLHALQHQSGAVREVSGD